MKRPTFEQACAQYVHRFTGEHIPEWSRKPMSNGRYYAPNYRTDREWYDATLFPGENAPLAPHHNAKYCYSMRQTFPLGITLAAPYSREMEKKP